VQPVEPKRAATRSKYVPRTVWWHAFMSDIPLEESLHGERAGPPSRKENDGAAPLM
jgi:hypothetical protein